MQKSIQELKDRVESLFRPLTNRDDSWEVIVRACQAFSSNGSNVSGFSHRLRDEMGLLGIDPDIARVFGEVFKRRKELADDGIGGVKR